MSRSCEYTCYSVAFGNNNTAITALSHNVGDFIKLVSTSTVFGDSVQLSRTLIKAVPTPYKL
jgi:ribosomal protein L28